MWNGVVTNAGLSLLEMWAAGGETLYIDRATAGTGTVAQDNMRSSTYVQGDVGAVPIVASIPVSSGTQYRIQVQPSQSASYILRQLGIWAHLGDNGASTLLALYQDEDGVSVPLEADDPGFNFTLYAIVTMSNQGSISVNYDTSAYVTRDALDEITDGMIKTVNFGGQVYTGDYAGAISIPVDAQPTENSNNTVKSGGVYDAVNTKVSKAGDTMTGDLSAANMTVNGDTNPSFYINIAGGTAVRILTRGTTGLRMRLYKTPGNTNAYEDYRLPLPTVASGSENYDLLTTKESVVNKYAAGDSFATASNYAVPFIGYVNSNGTILNFTVPTDKDLSGISSVAVDRWAGAIRTAAGEFIAGQSGSSFNWLTQSGVTVTAIKVGNALVRVSMTFTAKPTNAVENTPVVGAMLATFSFS